MRRFQIGTMVLLAVLCLTGCKNTQKPVGEEMAAMKNYMSRMGYREEDMEYSYGGEYAYDEHGNCISQNWNGKITTFSYEYDENGSLIRKTEYDSDGEVARVQEYADGNLIFEEQFYGGSKYFEYVYKYDDENQLMQREESCLYTEEPSVCKNFYKYDDAGRKVWEGNDPYHPSHTWEYDSDGNLIKECFSYTAIEYQYNEQGLLIHEKTVQESDWQERIIHESETSYTYDDEGRIVKKEETSTGHDEDGDTVKKRLYLYSYYSNIKKEDRYFQGNWRMTQVWRYDEAGNEILHAVFENAEKGMRMSEWSVFEYDEQNRVTQSMWMLDDAIVLYGGGMQDGVFVGTYRYDENGNTIMDVEKRQDLKKELDFPYLER